MKRIAIIVVTYVAIILAYVHLDFASDEILSGIRAAGDFWMLFAMSWLLGIVVTGVGVVIIARILKIDPRMWTGQDLRGGVLGGFLVSLFLGFESHIRVAQVLSLHNVQWHVANTYADLLVWCIVGGFLYVLYRFAEMARYRRGGFEAGKSDGKQMILFISKLVAAGALIVIFTLRTANSEFSQKWQVYLLDRGWNVERDSVVRCLTFENRGLSHRTYLQIMVQACRQLQKAGARVVVVPLPTNLAYSNSHADLVKEIAESGNVIFAVSPDRTDPEFAVYHPMENRILMKWGVISAMSLPTYPQMSYKYYPFKFRDLNTGSTVPDAAVVAVREFLRDSSSAERLVSGRRFSLGEYHTGLLKDQSAFILHRIDSYFHYRFYARVNDESDSIHFEMSLPETRVQTNLVESQWRLLEGKIVVIEPGEQITRTMNFAWTYSNIIHNILQKQGTNPFDTWTPLLTVLMLVSVACLLFYLKPWLSLLAVVALTLGQGYFYSWLAANYGVGVEPVPPILGTLLGLFAFWFVLIADERRQMERDEKKRMQEELKSAHDMQMGLMPVSDPAIGGFDISGVCRPAEEVGGDYFDYVWLNEEKTRLGIAIADVSGKAMKAAMTAVMTSGMVYRELGSNETPKTILRKINRPMYFKTDKRIFAAMSFAVIDTLTKSLAFSNAGQMQPLLKRKGQIESLKVEGARLPLGMAEDVAYNELTISLQSGDLLVFYTDGIPEAMNVKNEMFGFERLEAIVKESTSELSAKQIAAKIVEKVAEFAGATKQHDDMTVVVAKVS